MSRVEQDKPRRRAQDKWQEFNKACSSRAREKYGDDYAIRISMKPYYDKYKEYKKKMSDSDAWSKAVEACSDMAETSKKVSEKKTRPTSPIEIATKKIQIEQLPQAPNTPNKEQIAEMAEILAEKLRSKEQETSRRFNQLNEMLQKLGASGQENKELVKNIMTEATEKAIESASDNKNTNEELKHIADQIEESTKHVVAEAMNEIGTRFEELEKTVGRKLDRRLNQLIELKTTGETPKNISSTPEVEKGPVIDINKENKKQLTDQEFKNKIHEIEGVCEKMFPIINDSTLTDRCNAITDKDICNLNSGDICYYYEPGILESLFGKQAECVPKQDSLALLPSQFDEYINCKETNNEPIPEKYKNRVQQNRVQQKLNSEFEQLKQAKQLLDDSKNLLNRQESALDVVNRETILDKPRDLQRLPPVLLPPTTDVLPALPPVLPDTNTSTEQMQSELPRPQQLEQPEPELPEPQPQQLELPEPQPQQFELPEPQPQQFEQPEQPEQPQQFEQPQQPQQFEQLDQLELPEPQLEQPQNNALFTDNTGNEQMTYANQENYSNNQMLQY